MSCNWELKDTGDMIGTQYVGPNLTPAFEWQISVSHLQSLDSDLKVRSDEDEEMDLGDFLKKMVARPIQRQFV